MELTSAHNEYIRLTAAMLSGTKKRCETNRYVAEGPVSVLAAERTGLAICWVVCAESYAGAIPHTERVYRVSDDVFKKISGTVTPQGIVAVLNCPDFVMHPPSGDALVLDAVRDPGNMGTIVRTAAALGIRDVYLSECVDPFNPKAVRASMTGIFFVDFHFGTASEIISAVRNSCVLVADMGGENVFASSFSRPEKPFALIIGNEAHGVGSCFRRIADRTLALPMENVESLNAAVSAGILLYYLKHAKI